MTAPQKLTKAGDINLTEVSIVSSNGVMLNVTPQVVSIELFENLFESFINGKIVISESQALQTFFPLVGNEFLNLSFTTPSLDDEFSYKGQFFIYKSSDMARYGDRLSLYVLHFISKEAVLDQNKKISKTFKGNPEDMVRYLLGDNGLQTTKELFAETPRNTFAFCSNWWKPTKCIQWVLEHSVSPNGNPSYLFFENKRGFIFTSLDSLLDKDVPITMNFEVSNYSRQMGDKQSSYRDIMKDYQSILQIDYHTGYDYFKRLRSGFYGGEIVSMDITTQRYTHNKFNRSFENDSHLNPFSPVADKSLATTRGNLRFVPRMYNNFEDYGDSTNYDIIADREAILARLTTQSLTIQVYGRTDYSVGQKVTVTIPKSGQIKDGDSETKDKMISGTYIITGLCHNITTFEHRTILELAKDSFEIDINKSGMA